MPEEILMGPSQKPVIFPDELVAAFDSGQITGNGMKDFAVSSGQATPEELGLGQNAVPEVVPGLHPGQRPLQQSGQATLIQAGKGVGDLGLQALRAGAQFTGDEEGTQRIADRLAEREAQTAPVREAHPVASFIGDALPLAAIPGGKLAQLGAGFGEGFLQGDGIGDRLARGATNVGVGLVGAKIGDSLLDGLSRRVQRLTGRSNSPARDVLADAGVRLRPAQRISDDTAFGRVNKSFAEFFDTVRLGITGNQPLRGTQVRRLNEIGSEALTGRARSRITREVLSEAEEELSGIYNGIAGNIDDFLVRDPDLLQRVDDLAREAATRADSRGLVNDLNRLSNELTEGLTGRRFLQLRRELSARSSEFAGATDGTLARAGRGLMDEILERELPDSAVALQAANRRWQLLEVLRVKNVVSPEGNINTRSANAAMERFFPELSFRRVRNETARPLALALQATRELAPGDKGLTGDFLRSAGVLTATGGLPLLGGGSGSMLGSAIARPVMRPITDPLLGLINPALPESPSDELLGPRR